MSTFSQHPYRMVSNSQVFEKPDEYSMFSPEKLLTDIHSLDPNIRYAARYALDMFVPREGTADECPRCKRSEDDGAKFSVQKRYTNKAGDKVEYLRKICDRCNSDLVNKRYHQRKFGDIFAKRSLKARTS